jgi:hypothetical protein
MLQWPVTNQLFAQEASHLHRATAIKIAKFRKRTLLVSNEI